MHNTKKIFFTLLLTITMATSSVIANTNHTTIAQAATKNYINTFTLSVGETKKLILSGTNKKVTWSSNNNSVATVSSKGKVTAITAGDSIITAAVNGKKYICKVIVTDVVSSATRR